MEAACKSLLLAYVQVHAVLSHSNNTRPGSIVWSGQVAGMTRNTEFPISLRFNVDNVSI